MSLTVYRFGKAKHRDTLFDGIGGLYANGRWSPQGHRVVYASESASLALLEYMVHYKNRGWLPASVVASAEIPKAVRIAQVNLTELPADWDDPVAPSVLQKIGRQWLEQGSTAVLKVPSALVQDEWNYLLNPVHRDFKLIHFHEPAMYLPDQRLARSRNH
ncbi:MAG TPA: RES family NAD+ phosphorylase [Gammaproteobacteria bacterium]|nr:RES family NAD+ phosphorylase [Gammaproteobacteria bacterium]